MGVFPHIINASLLVFTLSAACTDIYCSSRTLYGLARDSQAPIVFRCIRPHGVPLPAVFGGAVFTLLAYLNVAKSSAVVFGYLVSLITVFAVLNWVSLLVSHIFFRRAIKAQGILLGELPYVSRLQPWGSYYALFMSGLIVFFYGMFTLSSLCNDPSANISRLRRLLSSLQARTVRAQVHQNLSLRQQHYNLEVVAKDHKSHVRINRPD